jgi:hypothetical protein
MSYTSNDPVPALLAAPHPQVAAAAGVWWRAGTGTGELARWLAGLPREAEAGNWPGRRPWTTGRGAALMG